MTPASRHLSRWIARMRIAADVTYGTNNEFGFDYLRDNMEHDLTQLVQRGHYSPSWTRWTTS